MKATDTGDLWWKTAVIYCLDVETFMDSNDDGVGDFAGLAQRIDYLAELGVTCLWLMPFYPTPGRDDGYDVMDFYGVDPRLGHLGDLVEVVRTARDRGIRVIADLVVNHTSDQHPWFRDARSSRDSRYRDFYVWRDEVPAHQPEPVFPDEEDGVWHFDEKTEQYYLHNFYHHQPDLNLGNPRVVDEIAKIIGFWLELGLSGFRIDAVSYMLEEQADGDPHALVRSLRKYLSRRSGDAVMLGENNLPYDEQVPYFGQGDAEGLTMQFDFVGMQHLYLSLARHDARSFAATVSERPLVAEDAQWANFVRNHDELTLDKLTDAERAEVFAAFAPDDDMRLFDRGIRRRLPPMLDGDPRRVRMVYSLLFSLPGTPVIFYGEEIGMGENLAIAGRQSVRTPMQWSDGVAGGFSSSSRRGLARRVPGDGYGPAHVNAATQLTDPDSLLCFFQLLIRRYRSSTEIGWGSFEVLDHDSVGVFAHAMTGDQGAMIAVHNFAAEPAVVTITVPGASGETRLRELLADGECTTDDRGRVELALPGYGYRWLRVHRDDDVRLS
ncbi:MAG: alpha-amylase family protein [Microcella sp.]|uniref:alpha-amylase family protein n=1 Tax=Microcella sp. TaxID=1913979 RepID=UPI0024CDFA61|nr:alpha-amylase family protein [Microcella sp.]UYN83838.1 MAG: alpha-amylase family protein [Microcella sp.]